MYYFAITNNNICHVCNNSVHICVMNLKYEILNILLMWSAILRPHCSVYNHLNKLLSTFSVPIPSQTIFITFSISDSTCKMSLRILNWADACSLQWIPTAIRKFPLRPSPSIWKKTWFNAVQYTCLHWQMLLYESANSAFKVISPCTHYCCGIQNDDNAYYMIYYVYTESDFIQNINLWPVKMTLTFLFRFALDL